METFFTKLLEWVWEIAEKYIFPWIIVRDYEGGVVLLFGKYHYTLKPGLNFKIPFIHESLTCLTKPETIESKSLTVTTTDNHTVSMTLVGMYHVTDPRKWLLEANDAGSNVYHHLIRVASDYITGWELEKLKKETAYNPIKKELNKEIAYLGAEVLMVGYGSICKTKPLSLINS